MGGYPHHTGHGLGATVHEAPRIVPGSAVALAEGMVIALEPGAYGENWGVRVEQVVVVTADGCDVLSVDVSVDAVAAERRRVQVVTRLSRSERSGVRVQSVERASRLLLLLARHEHGCTLTEAARALHLAVPTTHHLLATLWRWDSPPRMRAAGIGSGRAPRWSRTGSSGSPCPTTCSRR